MAKVTKELDLNSSTARVRLMNLRRKVAATMGTVENENGEGSAPATPKKTNGSGNVGGSSSVGKGKKRKVYGQDDAEGEASVKKSAKKTTEAKESAIKQEDETDGDEAIHQ
ncbi:MAG: hypothetical protein Q9159_003754 [Coniocarpon cinnabarinum]